MAGSVDSRYMLLSFINMPKRYNVTRPHRPLHPIMTETALLNANIAVTLALTATTAALFIADRWRVDISALFILALLGLLNEHPSLSLLPSDGLYSGLASAAVVTVIGITALGYAIDRSGLMDGLSRRLARGRPSERQLRLTITSGGALLSGLMQNIAAISLFIPIVSRLARRLNIDMGRLLMPVAFMIIIGGNLTLIGSGPLILINDLLPADLERFGLLDVTPIGLALLFSCGLLWFFLPDQMLPASRPARANSHSLARYQNLYQLSGELQQFKVSDRSLLSNLTVGQLEERYKVELLALRSDEVVLSPHRQLPLAEARALAIVGDRTATAALASALHLREAADELLDEALSPDISGFAEVVVRPGTALIDRAIGDIRIRKQFGLTPVAIFRGQRLIHSQLREVSLQAGDTLLCHMRWRDLAALRNGDEFAVLDNDFPQAPTSGGRGKLLIIVLAALAAALFSPLPLALVFLTAAVALVVSGVITINQTYQAISWQTVFLLAGLIPLGTAIVHTGTADWLTTELLAALPAHPSSWVLHTTFAIAATLATLFLSNIGATVVLMPIALQMASTLGFDPRPLALLVAVCASNSFLMPTHQVNSLIISAGNYSNRDFLRAGRVITPVYIAVAVAVSLLL